MYNLFERKSLLNISKSLSVNSNGPTSTRYISFTLAERDKKASSNVIMLCRDEDGQHIQMNEGSSIVLL